jgi:hypothetical protein
MLHVVDSTAECVDRSLAEIAHLLVALAIETMSNHGWNRSFNMSRLHSFSISRCPECG